MSFSQAQKLINRVEAQNRANRLSNELCVILATWLTPYIGKPIYNADGSLIAPLRKTKPEFLKDDVSVQWSTEASSYTLLLRMKTSYVTGEHTCNYCHQVSYFGKVDGRVLISLDAEPDHKVDYSSEFINQTLQAIEKTKSVLSALNSQLGPFSEYHS